MFDWVLNTVLFYILFGEDLNKKWVQIIKKLKNNKISRSRDQSYITYSNKFVVHQFRYGRNLQNNIKV